MINKEKDVYVIYVIKFFINKKWEIKYIGRTKDIKRRNYQHLHKETNIYLKELYSKYQFKIEVLISSLSYIQACKIEKKMIIELSTYYLLVNDDIGDNKSLETRLQISKGQKLSWEKRIGKQEYYYFNYIIFHNLIPIYIGYCKFLSTRALTIQQVWSNTTKIKLYKQDKKAYLLKIVNKFKDKEKSKQYNQWLINKYRCKYTLWNKKER